MGLKFDEFEIGAKYTTARRTVRAARSAGSSDDICAVYVAVSEEEFGKE